MNVIIELGPADMERLTGGDTVCRAGITVTPVGHPMAAAGVPAGQLMVASTDLNLLRIGLPMRMKTAGGDLVTVVAQRGEHALWAES